MAVGRPVLVVPPGLERLGLGCAVVAWKETREARRAVHDALPLLSLAERFGSQPTTARRGMPSEEGATSAWISTRSGRVPSIPAKTAVPGAA